jgi:hypothetical protein
LTATRQPSAVLVSGFQMNWKGAARRAEGRGETMNGSRAEASFAAVKKLARVQFGTLVCVNAQ